MIPGQTNLLRYTLVFDDKSYLFDGQPLPVEFSPTRNANDEQDATISPGIHSDTQDLHQDLQRLSRFTRISGGRPCGFGRVSAIVAQAELFGVTRNEPAAISDSPLLQKETKKM